MDRAGTQGALVSRRKGRTAHVRGRRNFYSDITAKHLSPIGQQAAPLTKTLGTRMEPLNLLPRNFMNLLREDAGMSFMESALLASLAVVVCLLLVLAARRSA